MINPNVDDTLPTKVQPPQKPETETNKRIGKRKRWLWIAGGVLFVLVAIATGAVAGYFSALQSRVQQERDQAKLEATTQFQLAVEDIEAGRYRTAQQRLEFVIETDPGFPGATEKLAEVLLELAMVSPPTAVVTPTPEFTPTPDLRGAEELFNHAHLLMRNREWSNAIATLDLIRQKDIAYRALEVDGLYYICLRFQGMEQISAQGNLEGGIYALALAEKFAPIDRDADGIRTWARLYLTGASFWEINWLKVLEYFSQIYPTIPNLRDGSGWTAAERYRIASIRYGDQLVQMGDYCAARDYYNTALAIGGDDQLAPTATAVQLLCAPPTATPPPATPTVPTEVVTPVTTPETETPQPESSPVP